MRKVLAVLLLALAALPAMASELRRLDGSRPPALRLPDASGQMHELAQYRGKAVVINFWATWCAPCRKEMPSLDRLQKRLGKRPFVLLAVDVGEDEARVNRFLDSLGLRFNVLYDRDGAAARAWGSRALPATFVIDAEGRMRYRLIGATEWDRGDAYDAIVSLLPRSGQETASTEFLASLHPDAGLTTDPTWTPHARQPR